MIVVDGAQPPLRGPTPSSILFHFNFPLMNPAGPGPDVLVSVVRVVVWGGGLLYIKCPLLSRHVDDESGEGARALDL